MDFIKRYRWIVLVFVALVIGIALNNFGLLDSLIEIFMPRRKKTVTPTPISGGGSTSSGGGVTTPPPTNTASVQCLIDRQNANPTVNNVDIVTVAVVNNHSAPIVNVSVNVPMPSGVVFDAALSGSISYANSTVLIAFAEIAVGQTAYCSFRVKLTSVGTKNITATVISITGATPTGTPSASVSWAVQSGSGGGGGNIPVQCLLSRQTPTPTVNDTDIVSVSVRNNHTATATGVVVSIPMTAGINFSAALSGSVSYANNVVNITFASIASGSTSTVATFRILLTQSGSKSVTATVIAAQSGSANTPSGTTSATVTWSVQGGGGGGGGGGSANEVPMPNFAAMTTNSGLDLSDIPNFSLPASWLSVYDMAQSQQNKAQLQEVTRGFKQIAHPRLGTNGMYNSTPYVNRIGFLNSRNDSISVFGTGSPELTNAAMTSQNIAKWQQVARLLGTGNPDGTNGLVFDCEWWSYGGNSGYQLDQANIHTLLTKTAWNDMGNSGGGTPKPMLMWGPYAPIEGPIDSATYSNPSAYVNTPWLQANQSGEHWWQYVSHVLVGMYYRHDTDLADDFKFKMYRNMISFETNLIYLNGVKPVAAMLYFHQEGGGTAPTTLLDPHIAEFMTVMPAMVGVKGYYAWAEGFNASTGDGRNWNTYKTAVASLKRVADIMDILEGGTFYRHNTQVSYNGGSTYETLNARQSYDSQKPMVRAVKNGNKIAIAGCNPYADNSNAVLNVKVKVDNQVFDLAMVGKKVKVMRYN